MANARSFIVNEERRYAALPYAETGNNHQKFSDIVNAYGLAGCQNQAWCATYQFALELMAFGRDDALSHWCMTRSNYCGYSVFETERRFAAKGRTGSTPKVGALVIFKRSHMGRVLSVNSSAKTFECGEGNTSNKQFNRDGNSCAVKTYSWTDAGIKSFCYIDYGDEKITEQKMYKAFRAAYEIAHFLHYRYGDSHSVPPVIGDCKIACDRMIALAMYILGYTNQPAGGFTVAKDRWMGTYLTKWGAKQITDPNALRSGDIVIFRNASMAPNAGWHAFGIVKFVSQSDVTKYDCGSQERIDAVQPFEHVPLNQWNGLRWFYCAYRMTDGVKDYYEFNPSEVNYGDISNSAYAASVIFKARGYKGVVDKATGKRKDLELNFKHTIGDAAAASQYVADRMRNGVRISVTAGNVNRAVWQDLLGGTLPFKLYELPRCQTVGLSVLFWQEQMRARGIRDDEGNEIVLDREWGTKTASTVRKYCRAMGLAERDIVDWEVWHSVCGDL